MNWRESYQPEGTRLPHQGDSQNKLWFTGKQEEATYGVSYFGARWYDSVMGRFLAMDPEGVSPKNPNSYAYANNNPYRFVDPDGRMDIEEVGGIALLGFVGIAIYNELPAESQRAMKNLMSRGLDKIRDPTFFPANVPLLPPVMNQDTEHTSSDDNGDGAKKLPDLTGKPIEDAGKELEAGGFVKKPKDTAGGYQTWVHPDGSRIQIRPNGEIVRLGPNYPGKKYGPRYNPDGTQIPYDPGANTHSTGENVLR